MTDIMKALASLAADLAPCPPTSLAGSLSGWHRQLRVCAPTDTRSSSQKLGRCCLTETMATKEAHDTAATIARTVQKAIRAWVAARLKPSHNEGMRAQRRAHDQRMKARARRIMRLWSRREPLDPRKVGVNASTHSRPCGGWMDQEGSWPDAPRVKTGFEPGEIEARHSRA